MLKFVRANYYLILGIAFAIACTLGLFDFITTFMYPIDHSDGQFDQVLTILTPFFVLAILVLYAMIFIRRLRDEYIDKLWQRAARSFGILTLVLPWLWLFGLIVHKLVTGKPIPEDPKAPFLPTSIINTADIGDVGLHQFEGVDFLLGLLWTYGPLLFVALFKWHAWRDRN